MTTYNETALLKTIEVLWGANAIPIAQHIYSVIDKATTDAFVAGRDEGHMEGFKDGFKEGEEQGLELGACRERAKRFAEARDTAGRPIAPREFYGDVMDSSRLGMEEVTIQHDSGDENDFDYDPCGRFFD